MRLSRRFRTVLLTLGFYAFAAGAVAYFAYHAHHGDRGLHAKATYKVKIAEQEAGLAEIRTERAQWERRVQLMRAEAMDRDLLDERARALLNIGHKNDVIFLIKADR
jgi:cell division protein FtsB